MKIIDDKISWFTVAGLIICIRIDSCNLSIIVIVTIVISIAYCTNPGIFAILETWGVTQ